MARTTAFPPLGVSRCCIPLEGADRRGELARCAQRSPPPIHEHRGARSRPELGVLRLSPRVPHRRAHARSRSHLTSVFGFATAINLMSPGCWISIWSTTSCCSCATRTPKPCVAPVAPSFPSSRGTTDGVCVLSVAPPDRFSGSPARQRSSEVGRDLHSAAVIYCGQVGAKDFPSDTRAKGRARWYAMQVEAARNIEVSHLVFDLVRRPRIARSNTISSRPSAQSLREISPRVRAFAKRTAYATCRRVGSARYAKSWGATQFVVSERRAARRSRVSNPLRRRLHAATRSIVALPTIGALCPRAIRRNSTGGLPVRRCERAAEGVDGAITHRSAMTRGGFVGLGEQRLGHLDAQTCHVGEGRAPWSP